MSGICVVLPPVFPDDPPPDEEPFPVRLIVTVNEGVEVSPEVFLVSSSIVTILESLRVIVRVDEPLYL